MGTLEDFAAGIRLRDVGALTSMMFEDDSPRLRNGYKTENELWDFKAGCPSPGKSHLVAWSELAVDVLAFHNARGGLLVFGVDDTFSVCWTREHLDSKLFNDQIRRFLPDRIWIDFHRTFIAQDQRYVGIALIPPRGPIFERFQSDAPTVKGRIRFKAGDAAIRENDSSRILSAAEAGVLSRTLTVPSLGNQYAVNEPFFRILSPQYPEFILRENPCKEVLEGLVDRRTAVTSIIGGGGSGKTALATWAALRAFETKQFEYIVSITAKDRELTSAGIQALTSGKTTFENLLDSILEVLQFPEHKTEDSIQKEATVRGLLGQGTGLLFVDNLETVDDARVIQFLDSLPYGVRALTTSRRTSVKVAVRPLTLAGMTSSEALDYIQSLSEQKSLGYVPDLDKADVEKLRVACDGLPLAMRWALSQCRGVSELTAYTDKIITSGAHDEELLEFCFRRVFEAMSGAEKSVLYVLSLFQRPLNTEAILTGTSLPQTRMVDATEDLISDSVVQRLFDSEQNDYLFMLLPITRSFVRTQMAKEAGLEEQVRTKLSDYFEARDVIDPKEKIVVREIRQGKGGAEAALVDLALAAQRRSDLKSAKALFQQALARNPRSWNASRQFAEFHRHSEHNLGEALRLYEMSARNAPTRGADRALIYREWGILLKDSGDPKATEKAAECFEVALAETPDDPIAIHSLALMLARKSSFGRVITLLEPLLEHRSLKTRDFAASVLLLAYNRTGELMKASHLRSKGISPWTL
jgi:tetratricopeptide (TPR) repeat protein